MLNPVRSDSDGSVEAVARSPIAAREQDLRLLFTTESAMGFCIVRDLHVLHYFTLRFSPFPLHTVHTPLNCLDFSAALEIRNRGNVFRQKNIEPDLVSGSKPDLAPVVRNALHDPNVTDHQLEEPNPIPNPNPAGFRDLEEDGELKPMKEFIDLESSNKKSSSKSFWCTTWEKICWEEREAD